MRLVVFLIAALGCTGHTSPTDVVDCNGSAWAGLIPQGVTLIKCSRACAQPPGGAKGSGCNSTFDFGSGSQSVSCGETFTWEGEHGCCSYVAGHQGVDEAFWPCEGP